VDFIGKLAALVPRPRTNLVRYHGCLAPHASIRAYVVRDGRGPPPSKAELVALTAARAPSGLESRAVLSCAPVRPRFCWAELMRRVFELDVLACPDCGGRMTVIAEINDRRVARRMLEHVGLPSECSQPWPARGPPELFGSGDAEDQRWPDDERGATNDDAD